MPLTIRERGQKVADWLKTNGHQSIEAIATAIDLSKSSVHRHQQALTRRHQYPESSFWETTVGAAWLCRLVVAVVYHFGIKQGVGAESLSAFFQAVHLETHVGSSASALRQFKHRIEAHIVAYEEAQAELCQPVGQPGICLGADETFFEGPILVLVELASGFIFTEVAGANRRYDTWRAEVGRWWHPSHWQCHFLVSDQAQALVKLAVTGLVTAHVSDLFHAMRALSRPIGSTLSRQLNRLKQQGDALAQRLSQDMDAAKQQALRSQLETCRAQQQQLEADQQRYHDALANISQTVHPFAIETSQWQFLEALTTQLSVPLATLSNLATTYGSNQAQSAIETFRAQIPSFATGIHAWWQWVIQDLATQTPDVDIQNWVLMALLPWVYWSQQAAKTRTPQLKARYQQAASDAFDTLMAEAMTLQLKDTELQQWVQWCQWMAAKYQRTSSAVEGRNGYLSQRHHASRGFSPQSLKVLTIIHNFDLKRADGTTAAQRLFGQSFPDLFEWVLSNIDEVPMPRMSPKARQAKPLHGELFPA